MPVALPGSNQMRDEDPADPTENPFHRVVDPWEQVIEDMEATAAEYEEAGWDVVTVHPGDVFVMTGEPRTLAEEQGEYEPDPQRLGLDVVVPGEEYDAVRALAGRHDFDSYEAFRAVEAGIVFTLVVLESATEAAAVFVPTYYEVSDLQDLRAVADEYGLYTHVRSLASDEVVTFTHADPEPFFPDPDELGD